MSNYNYNKKYHFIYKTTNMLTDEYYIGMHTTNNLKDSYLGSGKRLKYSINKYGRENFKLEILEYLPNRELLIERERELVNVTLLNEPNCLNLQIGGISGYDHIRNLRKNDSEYDKKWREMQSIKMKKLHENGGCTYDNFIGKKHSKKTKEIMSEKKRGKGCGKTNSQYGTCWITNNKIDKKIKKEELEHYLLNGWIRGRI